MEAIDSQYLVARLNLQIVVFIPLLLDVPVPMARNLLLLKLTASPRSSPPKSGAVVQLPRSSVVVDLEQLSVSKTEVPIMAIPNKYAFAFLIKRMIFDKSIFKLSERYPVK